MCMVIQFQIYLQFQPFLFSILESMSSNNASIVES